MTRDFTIAQARDHLSEVVRLAEDEGAIELTRRGKPVAMVISAREYLRLCSAPEKPFAFLERIRTDYDAEHFGLEPADLGSLRDRSPGRAVRL